MLGTNVKRVELREGLETMSLSRFQRKTHADNSMDFVFFGSPARTFFSALVAVVLVAFTLLSPVLVSAVDAQSGEQTISVDGVGNAELGLTADELAAALGDAYEVGDEVRITVDFNGRVITKDRQVQFRAAATDASDQLNLIIVSNPDYATVEGVGPATTIADAEAIYGDATLSWNPGDEGREFVSFENGPGPRMFFRTPGIGGTNVGVYDDGDFETTEYESDAVIAAVWISCVNGTDCPADRVDPTPTATPEPEPEPEPTATPEPEPEPTATPDPEPVPTATPEPTNGGDDGAGGGELPKTGSSELLLLSVVSALVLVGGVLMVIERQYLCPAWLSGRK